MQRPNDGTYGRMDKQTPDSFIDPAPHAMRAVPIILLWRQCAVETQGLWRWQVTICKTTIMQYADRRRKHLIMRGADAVAGKRTRTPLVWLYVMARAVVIGDKSRELVEFCTSTSHTRHVDETHTKLAQHPPSQQHSNYQQIESTI